MSKLKNNERLSVHLRVYRGKTMTYNAQGQSTNEQILVKLEYNTAEYKRFLAMLRANGYIKATVEKVLDLTKSVEGKDKDEPGYYEEVKDFSDIQKEVDTALNPEGITQAQTPEQKQIAELTARLDALTGAANKSEVHDDLKSIAVKDFTQESTEPIAPLKTEKTELSEDDKNALNDARAKYTELYGKKGHNGWDLAEINKRIAEFKPEAKK